MNIFEEYGQSMSMEFPLPNGEEWPEPFDSPKEKWSTTVSWRRWVLEDVRANRSKDGEGVVINLRARALEGDYEGRGEVAYWLYPKRLDNPRDPSRRLAGALAHLLVDIGAAQPELFTAATSSKEYLDVLYNIALQASGNIGDATFGATLVFEQRSYEKDGEVRNVQTIEFRGIKDGETKSLPF